MRNLRTPDGALYSQLMAGSAAGPMGNPEGESDDEPAQSGNDGCERLEAQAAAPPGISCARKDEYGSMA